MRYVSPWVFVFAAAVCVSTAGLVTSHLSPDGSGGLSTPVSEDMPLRLNGEYPSIDLTAVDARQADFRDADMTSGHLAFVDLREANLSRATLRGAVLAGAQLGGATLIQVDLVDADLSRASGEHLNLGRALLLRVRAAGAKFPAAVMTSADMRQSSWAGSDLSEAVLTDACLKGATFLGADLSRAKLVGADLRGANFRAAKLHEADLSGVIVDARTVWPTQDFQPPAGDPNGEPSPCAR